MKNTNKHLLENNLCRQLIRRAEAAGNALATGKDAVLFNPASPVLDKYGLSFDNYEANMVSYIIEGEVLSETVGRIWKLPGEKKFIDRDSDWKSIFNRYIMRGGAGLLPSILQIKDAVEDHGLSNFVK